MSSPAKFELIGVLPSQLYAAIEAKRSLCGRYPASVKRIRPEDMVTLDVSINAGDGPTTCCAYHGRREPFQIRQARRRFVSINSRQASIRRASFMVYDGTIIYLNSFDKGGIEYFQYFVCHPDFRPRAPRLYISETSSVPNHPVNSPVRRRVDK